MLIYTAKLTKKKVAAGIIAAALIICAVIAVVSMAGGSKNTEEAVSAPETVKNNVQRIAFLESYGWEVSPSAVEEQDITIPKEFSGVYAKYNELQVSQGFDLSKYCGKDAVRYTYEILNYPGYSGTVMADIIVYKNRVIAGDVQATSLEGFMHGLEMPAEGTTAQTENSDAESASASLDSGLSSEEDAQETAALGYPAESPGK